MARTPSTMLELGTSAPDFSLPEPLTDNRVSLSDYTSKPLLVVFACNHCPYVIHIIKKLSELARDFQSRGVSVVMINANDVENYADDSPQKMIKFAQSYAFSFPYLYDESQHTAQAYRAACTPDFFLFDASHKLVYRGQFDASRPGNDEAVSGSDLSRAVDALVDGQPPVDTQIPSLGCNIKWKAGNEPDYF